MTAVQNRLRSYGPGAFVAVGLIVLGFFYPQYFESLGDLPLIGDFIPSVGSMVIMIAFTMMAVGLNIVVGYAGLLDLGYVAFYAVGAYTAAWFASQQFDQWTFHFGSVGISKDVPGIHLSMWLVLIIAGALTAAAGILIGLPTLRLRGDYLAIVTLGFGEIIPQVVRNGDNVFGFDLTHGTFGISPIDSPGFGSIGDSLGPAAQLPAVVRPRPVVLLDRARAAAVHRLLLGAAPRLAARPRLDRDPRGRDRGGRDGRAADADEDLVVRDRRLLRRCRGRLLRELQERGVPVGLLLQHLRLPALHGHPRRDGLDLGRDPRRHDPRLPERRRPGHARLGAAAVGSPGARDFDPTKYQFGFYGVIIVLMMLFRPEGLIPERRHKRELQLGVHDTPLYDVTHEGALTDRDLEND